MRHVFPYLPIKLSANFTLLARLTVVLPAIAQTFQLQASAALSPLEHLQTYLNRKCILLVLDNFEQVIKAAPLLVKLLTACPRLQMLITSRESLRVRGERELSLVQLALPEPTTSLASVTLEEYGAIALFCERARAALPTFQLTDENTRQIVEICRSLDGLPLALELAAAQLAVFSPHPLLARLDGRLTLLANGARDLPARLQTLRATVEWSYDLLSSQEQRLFRLLSCFVGCTLEALETIYATLEGENAFVVAGVGSLLNKHLLSTREQAEGERRLLMLETIRADSQERLLASQEKRFWSSLSYCLFRSPRVRQELFPGFAHRCLDMLSLPTSKCNEDTIQK